MANIPTVVEINPSRFYAVVDLIQKEQKDPKRAEDLGRVRDRFEQMAEAISKSAESLNKTELALLHEARMTSRRDRAFSSDMENEDLFKETRNFRSFLRIAAETVRAFQDQFSGFRAILSGLEPGNLILSKKRHSDNPESFEALQHMSYELQMNRPTIESYVGALGRARMIKADLLNVGRAMERFLDDYYQGLTDRHSVQGIKVHRDPIATDVAISIYENVDAHGEIESGKDPSKLTAYSMRKARVLAEALKTPFVEGLIRNPESFSEFIRGTLELLWKTSDEIEKFLSEHFKVLDKVSPALKYKAHTNNFEFEDLLMRLDDLDPSTVEFRESHTLLTKEERFNAEFRNETLAEVVEYLTDPDGTSEDLIQYILERKAELRRYFQDENSFYTCRISAGNPFLGEAPGALSVIPSQRPHANLNDILGSGFADIKDFIESIDKATQFHDLFLATSPSKTADKSNVLLVGPMGCGKSEILRAVGADPKSISIFASGSDFLTCWKGEAEKNPKRLFEAGLKLQKEARKQVHFLIDEIDSVLNNDKGMGQTNLTLEFQILMDGVVHYPGLSVWGATNFMERIPMPMIRRFNKVAIVGELEQDDRVKLLQHFVNFLPTKNFGTNGSSPWGGFAKKLEGATGDVVRKIADHLWRAKMTEFVKSHPKVAEEIVKWLGTTEGDGKSFNVSSFTREQREELKGKIVPYVHVTPEDVEKTIGMHLDNQAIIAEIETAKATYQNAREFLASIKATTI